MSNPTELPDLAEAVRKLVNAKGRFHTAQNYAEVVEALARHDACRAQPEGEAPVNALERLRLSDPDFVAHLERTSVEVAKWPSWKRSLWLSAKQPDGEARCVICGSAEPRTGTCGSDDPRALCKAPAGKPEGEARQAVVPWQQRLRQGDATLPPLCGAQHAESGKEDGLTIGEAFKAVGGWMNGGELGYPSFGSMNALLVYTQKMVRAALAAQSQGAQAAHPDDLAVDRFAAAMKAKMAASRAKGRSGWGDPAQCSTDRLQAMLADHLHKGDPVDVGNFAMMLWSRNERTAAQQAAAPGALAGYAWLPLEPTEAMVHAAEDLPAPRMIGKVWRAMATVAASATGTPEAPKPARPKRLSEEEVRELALQHLHDDTESAGRNSFFTFSAEGLDGFAIDLMDRAAQLDGGQEGS